MTKTRTNQQGAPDGRALDHATLEQIRLRAVERVFAGESQSGVARAIGMAPEVVCRWVARARAGGIEALAAKPVPGRAPALDDRQVAFIRALILSIDPAFWGFDSPLWTRAMVAHVIFLAFGVELGERAVGQIMRRRMGLSPQRPVRRAFESDEAACRVWAEETYPAIRERAKARGATIYFADEASMASEYHSGTTWAEVGKTPVVGATGQKFKLNLISAISPAGEMKWMEIDGRQTAERFIEFLERLIKRRRKLVVVIVDRHPTHTANAVTAFVEANKDRLELHYLPGYSPQLNPDEQVWLHLKHHTIGKRAIRLVGELRRAVEAHLEWMAGARRLIRSFFEERHCRYASARLLKNKPTPALMI